MNKNRGLEYFPLDVGYFRDKRIQFVTARFGAKGDSITMRLLCEIYEQGYYIDWNNDIAQLFAKGAGINISPTLVSEVVLELAKRGFFDKTLLDSFSILTSHKIQERYFTICKNAERKGVIYDPNFILVDISKYENVTPVINVAQKTEFTHQNTVFLTFPESSREKEKEKESKEKEKESKEKKSKNNIIINHHCFPSISEDNDIGNLNREQEKNVEESERPIKNIRCSFAPGFFESMGMTDPRERLNEADFYD